MLYMLDASGRFDAPDGEPSEVQKKVNEAKKALTIGRDAAGQLDKIRGGGK